MELHPYAIIALVALLVIATLSIWLRSALRFRGYRAEVPSVKELASTFRGRVVRDGDGLLIRGAWQGRRLSVRVSNSLSEPGLYIRIPLASRFQLYCGLKREALPEADKLVPEALPEVVSPIFTSDRAEARLILGSNVVAEIRKLATRASYLSLANGSCDFSEEAIPTGNLAAHVIGRLRSLTVLVRSVEGMSALDALPTAKGSSAFWRWSAEAIVWMALAAAIVFVGRQPRAEAVEAGSQKVLWSGLPGDVAALIPHIEDWRLLQPADFTPETVSWLRQFGQSATAEVSLAGPEGTSTRAFVLIARSGDKYRVVVVRDNQLRFDAEIPHVAMLTKLPASEFQRAVWSGAVPPFAPDGDGVVIVRDLGDPASGMVIYLSGLRLIPLVPQDFRSLQFRP